MRKTLKDPSLYRYEITRFEREANDLGFKQIAGIDEVGRGPLAGPVVACACILPEDFFLPGIKDSKQLSSQKREELYSILISHVMYAVALIEPAVIDKINILQASLQAMQISVQDLQMQPDFALVDGNHLPSINVPAKAIIQGDSKSQSIMAASIIAKVTRDRYMIQLASQWPEYGFALHKGYPTKDHLKALEQFGPCPAHRLCYAPVKKVFSERKRPQLECV